MTRHLPSAALVASLAFTLSMPLAAQETGADGRDRRAAMEAMRGAAQRAMTPVLWLVGEWEGPATITVAPGRTMTLTQRERVREGAFQTALFIEGRGTMLQGGVEQTVFEAAGLLSYDAPKQRFLFMSTGGSGAAAVHETTIEGSTFTWSFTDGRGATTRYVITRTPDDRWHETGAVSTDGGKTWTQNFEMTLVRRK